MGAATGALHVRKVDGELMRQIRMEAAAAGVDVRVWVIEQLARACGLAGRHQAQVMKRKAAPRSSRSVALDQALGEPPKAPTTAGTLRPLTSHGLPRCQNHDDTCWQCRLPEGHGNNCM